MACWPSLPCSLLKNKFNLLPGIRNRKTNSGAWRSCNPFRSGDVAILLRASALELTIFKQDPDMDPGDP